VHRNESKRIEKALLLMIDENRRSIPETNEELIGGRVLETSLREREKNEGGATVSERRKVKEETASGFIRVG